MSIVYSVSSLSKTYIFYKTAQRYAPVLLKVLLCLLPISAAYSEPLLKYDETGFSKARPLNDQKSPINQTSALQEEVNTLRYELFQQQETFQEKLQGMQGILEEQRYQIDQLKKAERNRYADLDRRMTAVETQASQQTPRVTNNSTTRTMAEEDKKTYFDAIQKVENKEYNAAIAELVLYLEFFPEGKYLPQAHYWLGELYLALKEPEYDTAISHFETVVNDFSVHAKAPDSLYKLGKTQLILKNKESARVYFEKLIQQYPSSASAALAETELSKIK